MTVKDIQQEVYYYTGKKITIQEAEELLSLSNNNPSADFSEIVRDYYEC